MLQRIERRGRRAGHGFDALPQESAVDALDLDLGRREFPRQRGINDDCDAPGECRQRGIVQAGGLQLIDREFPVVQRAGHRVADAELRGDFRIGEGAWSKFDIVANDVNVKFRITATGK